MRKTNTNTATYEQQRRAWMYRALGDPTRLQIFEFVRERVAAIAAAENADAADAVAGPTAGEIARHVTGAERVTSTVSFHLRELSTAGLLQGERRGRAMVYTVVPDAVAGLAAHLAMAAPPEEKA